MTSLESSDLQRIFKKVMIFLTFYLFPDLSREKLDFLHQKLSFWIFDTFKTKVFDFQTSISRNHASRVLHNRFPPFGFVLKPVRSVHMSFNVIMADSSKPCKYCSPWSISPLRVCIQARLVGSYVFKRVMVDSCQKPFFKTSISWNHAYRVLHSRFPPFGFVFKPCWSIHMCFNIVMADSCQKSFFKTSISRNHAYRVLHSRFPPSGSY